MKNNKQSSNKEEHQDRFIKDISETVIHLARK